MDKTIPKEIVFLGNKAARVLRELKIDTIPKFLKCKDLSFRQVKGCGEITIRLLAAEQDRIRRGKVTYLCVNCRWWDKRSGNFAEKEHPCRRLMPHMVKDKVRGVWPLTRDTDFCGDFQPKVI